MGTMKLPDNADLGQLRAQAKELRRAYAGGSPAALARVGAVRPEGGAGALHAAPPAGGGVGEARPELLLRHAQYVIAREHGFDGWRDLVQAVVVQQSGGRDLHRWFAVELNNSTWDLVENGLCSDSPREEREQALYAAYASTYHWMQAGTVVHHGRGEYLIAAVATSVGLLDVAARHAARYAGLIDAHPGAFADWDRAFAAEGLARVASRSGAANAAELRAGAERLAEAVAEPEDRRICLDRLAAAPW